MHGKSALLMNLTSVLELVSTIMILSSVPIALSASLRTRGSTVFAVTLGEGDGCQYCHFCQICLRTGLCFGCQARKKSDAGEGDETGEGLKSLKVYERCERCRVWMCNECCSTARNGVMQCPHCHVWICGKCAGGWCHSCP
ncbi:hypothetical protein L210DRAFT_2724813 [Boletus edulis BED1]|uniref:Uncharacterized protein n=1 Tax=Boletus edulis BED1 TaxID=1328754 RepID=A0AAD4G664_BOLED|nr:hypothetical protein L210DRAFT_2724813 [Boletus edulis BED1]